MDDVQVQKAQEPAFHHWASLEEVRQWWLDGLRRLNIQLLTVTDYSGSQFRIPTVPDDEPGKE